MENNTDTEVLALLVANNPHLRELIEAERARPAVCSTLAGIASANLEAKCGKKAFTIQGRFCEQQDCGPVDLPTVQPCFQLHWGDGPSDQIETEDFEVLCLTACNPFSNVTFKDLKIVIGLVFGPPPNPVPALLPDGTPSVLLTPSEEICFGDLGPCSSDEPKGRSCVSREVVLKTQGAVAGQYFLAILPCYEVAFHPNDPGVFGLLDYFQFTLVKS